MSDAEFAAVNVKPDAFHWFPSRQMLGSRIVDVLELGVAVGVAGSLQPLAV